MNRTAQGILFGTAISLGCMLALSLPVAALIYYTSLSQQYLGMASVVIDSLALFFGGWAAGRKAGARGLVLGLIVGAIILALMAIFGGVGAGFWPRMLYCLIAPMIGGICGVK